MREEPFDEEWRSPNSRLSQVTTLSDVTFAGCTGNNMRIVVLGACVAGPPLSFTAVITPRCRWV